MITNESLMAIRRVLIQLLNALDDALELPRTIPPKTERRNLLKEQR